MSAIAHVLPTISRSLGGPSVSVRRLVESLSERRPTVDWAVFAGESADSSGGILDWQHVRPRVFPELPPRRFGWSPRLRIGLLRQKPALIHVHGLWRYHTWAALSVADRLGIPLVVSPRGMLDPWALQRSRAQKWIVNYLFQRRMWRAAAVVVATSELEARGIRAAGLDAPIAIIPNGIDLPPEVGRFDDDERAGRTRTALFLSRIHPKKGVLELVEAWRRVQPAGWRLRIVGPSEVGHAAEVRSAIRDANLGDRVEVSDPVWGEAKFQALRAADLFVLPSHSENFGLAIGEALAAELPVVTTRATPWREIEIERCGWWIEVGVDSLTATLRHATSQSPSQLKAMGVRGRNLIARRYSWASVATQMAKLYDWALQRNRPPIPPDLAFPS